MRMLVQLMLKILTASSPQILKIIFGPFRGAKVYLNPKSSKRKIFGIYEYVLNNWISEVVPRKEFVFDIGANTGYDTYGFAHLLSKANSSRSHVIAFEPDADDFPELTTPKDWPEYANITIEIVKKFVSDHSNASHTTTTIDEEFSQRPQLKDLEGLFKIDVEGAEVQVLEGASELLKDFKHDWLIEIHGKDLIPPVTQFFSVRGRPFLIKEMKPLPLIGPEQREIDTYWLLTI